MAVAVPREDLLDGSRIAQLCPGPLACGYMPGEEIRQHWHLPYVALSLIVSACGAFTSLVISHHLQHCAGQRRWYATFIALGGMGIGVNTIWGMHFVGMTAVVLDGGLTSGARGEIAIHFDALLTVVSGLLAWAFASLGLHLSAASLSAGGSRAGSRRAVGSASAARDMPGSDGEASGSVESVAAATWTLGRGWMLAWVLAPASSLAVGMCSMHYLGMRSQVGFFSMQYSPLVVAASAALAVVVATAGLCILFRFPTTMLVQLAAAIVISASVDAVHYCGMASATYRVSADRHTALLGHPQDVNAELVALAILVLDLLMYVVCNSRGESLRLALEDEKERALEQSMAAEKLSRNDYRRRQAKEEQALRRKLEDAIESVDELGHPMVLVPAWRFLQIQQDEVAALHEGFRESKALKILDTMDDALAFKRSGASIVFFSYECLAWSQAGPNEVQLDAMKAALRDLAGELEGSTFVWLDCFSIPQRNQAMKRKAIDCIYTFAQIPDHLVIVCPDSVHADTLAQADSESIKRRLWCRLEHLAYYCSHGVDTMRLHRGRGLEALPEGWIDEICCVFDAEATCCRLRHRTTRRCDREMAVLPLLALYFDVYSQVVSALPEEGSPADAAWKMLSKRKSEMFPKRFMYARVNREMEERVLFGNTIELVEQLVHDMVVPRLN